jgi:hypothetical protein
MLRLILRINDVGTRATHLWLMTVAAVWVASLVYAVACA